MNRQLFQIKRNLKNSNLNNKYLFIDFETKFIYEDALLKQVMGMNNFLRNKIVEIIQEKMINGKKMALIKVDNELIGWTEISEDNLIRLYRLPKINGKLIENENTEYTFNNISYKKDINNLKGRIIKAYYIFYYKSEKFIIVGKLDGKITVPVKIDSFKKLIFPEVDTSIYLSKGTSLYSSSNFNQKLSEIKEEKNYKIIAYINDQNEARIELGNQRYWIRTEEPLPNTQTFTHDLETLEVVDFITYLFENNKYNEDRAKILDNKLNKIRKNIIYNNDDDEIYIKSHLGDNYDN